LAVAIAALRSGDGERRANALELLEAADPAFVRPLLPIWELVARSRATDGWLEEVLADEDAWLRECAAFLSTRSRSVKTLPTLALVERVMFLRKVPLFEDLAPGDLKHVATLASERLYPSGAVRVRQGGPGEELYIVVSGSVRVVTDGRLVAVRGPGDSVGEMAILTGEPRSATLSADGEVRALAIDRRQFEAILRDRPEIGLAVIRTLAQRLRERADLEAYGEIDRSG
jgi:hypothetical protein